MNNYTKLLNNLELLELVKIKENLNQYIDLINEKKKDLTDALYELTNLEIETKETKKITNVIRFAGFPFLKDLQDYDFSFQPTLNKDQILEFKNLRFIENKENILFVGSPGVGKTHLATAIGLEVARQKKIVLFTNCNDLINNLKKAFSENRLDAKLKQYAKYKVLIIFYVISIIVSILTRITTMDNPSLAILVINKILYGTVIAFVVNIIVNTLMRSWVRFKSNVYGDESYLTHTLPVKKETIYLSKILSSIITMLTSMLVIFISLFVACYSKDLYEYISSSLAYISGIYDISIFGLIVLFLTVITVELFTLLVSGITGLLFGHRKNNNKMLYSILFGFITYVCAQLIVLGSVYLVGLTNKGIMQIFKTNQILSVGVLKELLFIIIVVYILVIIGINLINVFTFKKGVNVE